MKIAYVTAQFPFGSAESFLEAEVRALSRQGVEVVLAPVRRPGTLRTGTVDLAVLPRARVPSVLMAAFRALRRSPASIVRLVGEILSERRHAGRNLLVLPWGLHLGERMRAENVDHIHAHWLSTSATVAWIASRTSGVPFSVTAHRWDIEDANLASSKARDAAFLRFISQAGRVRFRELGYEAPRGRVIHMGVDGATQPACGTMSAAHAADVRSGLRILVPANLVEIKGHRHLVKALALTADDIRADFAGDGEQREAITRAITESGVQDRVRLLGHVSHDGLLSALDRGDYDCVVLPSVDLGGGEHEGIPVTLMEAMVRGVAVVSTSTGAIPELVDHGRNGLLARPADPEDLATQLLLLRDDPVLRRALGEAGRVTVMESFSADGSARALADEMTGMGDAAHHPSQPPTDRGPRE